MTECVSNVVSNVESAVACLAPSESSCLSLFFIVFILISHGHKSGACLLPALFSIRVSLDWFLLVVHRAYGSVWTILSVRVFGRFAWWNTGLLQ